MKHEELPHIITAIIVLFIVISFEPILSLDTNSILNGLLFSIIIIAVSIYSKKLIASYLDSDVEHRIWSFSRFGLRPHQRFKKEIPAGIILPLFFSILSLGFLKFMAVLTYETRALKRRAAKRHGFYSFTEMTEWHNAIVGAAGIAAVLLLSLIAYFIPITGLEQLSKMAAFYAFFNMLPISNLDGTQIFFGSRVLWTALAIITIILTSYALLLV